jgi:hypothetical protein
MPKEQLNLNEKVLLAAKAVSGGNVEKDFTAEDLVVAVWKQDPQAFGLRGHEQNYPDSNKVYTKIDGKSGLVAKGWLAKHGERTLRITMKGLSEIVGLTGDQDAAGKLDRQTQDRIAKILGHPVFQSWLQDRSQPTKFRDAGYFWGIAPGTPASTVRSRILDVRSTLQSALRSVEERGWDGIVQQRGQALFEIEDIQRALEFQDSLLQRFQSDIRILDPKADYIRA